jgi:hypothetical protein
MSCRDCSRSFASRSNARARELSFYPNALVKYIVGESENCSDNLFQCFLTRFAEVSSSSSVSHTLTSRLSPLVDSRRIGVWRQACVLCLLVGKNGGGNLACSAPRQGVGAGSVTIYQINRQTPLSVCPPDLRGVLRPSDMTDDMSAEGHEGSSSRRTFGAVRPDGLVTFVRICTKVCALSQLRLNPEGCCDNRVESSESVPNFPPTRSASRPASSSRTLPTTRGRFVRILTKRVDGFSPVLLGCTE